MQLLINVTLLLRFLSMRRAFLGAVARIAMRLIRVHRKREVLNDDDALDLFKKTLSLSQGPAGSQLGRATLSPPQLTSI